MHVTTSIQETRDALTELCEGGKSLGFVPTMGAMHGGHGSLIRLSKDECDVTAASIFVNPTQFGEGEDLERYPRRIEEDKDFCKRAGVDLVFAPPVAEMYPSGYATYVLQERFTEPWEGEVRTGHFHGVCTVCCKLFNIVRPHFVYFGRKDYQQSVVIRHMLRDLNFRIELRLGPIVRDKDGLAMSSRNSYLSPEERAQASSIFRGLQRAEEMFSAGERSGEAIAVSVRKTIEEASLARIDYVAVVNPETLREIRAIEDEAVVLVAVRFGDTRLIDNTLLSAHG